MLYFLPLFSTSGFARTVILEAPGKDPEDNVLDFLHWKDIVEPIQSRERLLCQVSAMVGGLI